MKHSILILTGLFIALSGQAMESKEEFKAAVIRILNQQDWDGYKALTFMEGMSEYDQKMMETMKPIILDGKKVISAEFADLPQDHRTSFVYDGRAFEPTITPLGLLKFAQDGGGTTLQYAKNDDRFVLVGTKSEDLGWEGPDDVPLGIVIHGYNNEALTIEASWNSSGRSFSQKLDRTSTSFLGQYVDKVTVRSDDPDAVFQLQILEGGEEVYKSEKKQGAGEIQYKRAVNQAVDSDTE